MKAIASQLAADERRGHQAPLPATKCALSMAVAAAQDVSLQDLLVPSESAGEATAAEGHRNDPPFRA